MSFVDKYIKKTVYGFNSLNNNHKKKKLQKRWDNLTFFIVGLLLSNNF